MTEEGDRGLEILGLVDLHWSGKRELRLPDLQGVDLVLLGGDITHFRGVEEARTVIDAIRTAGPRVLAVCGNCDQPEIESYLEAENLALDRQVRTVDGVHFAGLSAGLPFGGCPYERTEEEYTVAIAELSAYLPGVGGLGPTILVSHQPPHDTLCDVSQGAHVGSTTIRQFILDREPDLVLCGHIHESVGDDWLGASRVVNPGPWFAGNLLRMHASTNGIEILD